MATLPELLRMIVENVFQLIDVFFSEVILGVDPLSAVLWLVGQLVIVFSVAFLGYLTLGAVLDALGVSLPTIGRRGPTDH